ncbi:MULTISPECIES: ABC-F family ATP-binding cassette domain-containing protein [Streptomyces]|uniref:ABC transporter ATP-binding protein n=4 Tax=Streptomyces TaxID=1883 RepID=A0A7H1QCT4_9ACTN|nr:MULTISPECIES: ABC-F family ATP-binding cassette domain-containing protein [Streptomyces]ADN64224.1 LkcJ [Streptomyces rochei subsp. volubilis]MBA9050708.1 ATPase subunit of ABC transporter with duplicated ATPase domains [Streptomyces murinus]QNT98114.1 ABC transporter ATP-binding protein [Streptomyces griseofuscus]BAC76467.1 putative ABC transporter protein [Streptomyces rochei]
MTDASIVCSNLSFSWPDGTPVFHDLSWSVGEGHTGLVAPNGAGKSTLLKLITGALRPNRGSVTVQGLVGYLPQTLPLTGDLTVAEVLGIAPVIEALDAIASGDVSEEHFATIGDDWDIEERSRAQLDRLGLGDIALTRRLHDLSGGQVVSLGLATQLLKRPDVLLLDEPTNNLDLDARRRLYQVLESFGGCLLVVSHDRALLDLMDTIAELESGEMRLYGGNYTDYEEAVRAEQETAEKNIRTAEQQVKREKREMQQARERAVRRAGIGARAYRKGSMSKMAAGTLKRRAQESAGKSNDTHGQRLADAKARLDDASRMLRDDRRIALELPDTNVPAGRTVFLGEGINVRYGGREIFAGDGVSLTIRGPERIALTGSNGVGKSTLLRVISGELEADRGEFKRADGRIAYLSQRLDTLPLDRTVAQCLADYAPLKPEAERMNLLARFLFRGAAAHLPVGALSGGERLRATLACVLGAEPAPQLLLLDEPTNNLDLDSVEQLEGALNSYEGAFIVVSHDERFVKEIGVDRWLRLADGRLLETGGPADE